MNRSFTYGVDPRRRRHAGSVRRPGVRRLGAGRGTAWLERAFDGADTVFWLVSPDRTADSVEAAYVGFTRPAAEVLRRLAIPRVVGITAIGLAEAAARLLLDHSWTGVEEVPLLGPEDISFEDMAQTMTEVLGRPVRFQPVSFGAYQERFRQMGMSEAMARGQTDMARAKDAGLDNHVTRTPENTTPTSFRQWCEAELKPLVLT
jgi:hypothetical protein